MEEDRNVFRMFTGKPTGKRPPGRPSRRWENIRTNIQEIMWKFGLIIGIFVGPSGSISEWVSDMCLDIDGLYLCIFRLGGMTGLEAAPPLIILQHKCVLWVVFIIVLQAWSKQIRTLCLKPRLRNPEVQYFVHLSCVPGGLGGLGVPCSRRDPRFAGSNPIEVDEFFQDVKILSTSSPRGTLSWGSWIWDFRLVKEPQAWKNRPLSKI